MGSLTRWSSTNLAFMAVYLVATELSKFRIENWPNLFKEINHFLLEKVILLFCPNFALKIGQILFKDNAPNTSL